MFQSAVPGGRRGRAFFWGRKCANLSWDSEAEVTAPPLVPGTWRVRSHACKPLCATKAFAVRGRQRHVSQLRHRVPRGRAWEHPRACPVVWAQGGRPTPSPLGTEPLRRKRAEGLHVIRNWDRSTGSHVAAAEKADSSELLTDSVHHEANCRP